MYHIGCSGWQYNHWQHPFYPPDLPKKDWLAFYASFFHTVEINSTFYRTPSEKTLNTWYRNTPPNFIFSIKAHRYITHRKKLIDVEDAVPKLYAALAPLKEKLGPILWQLPPSLVPDSDRLETFFKLLDKKKINVLEFRNKALFADAKIATLAASYQVLLCTVIAPDLPTIWKPSDTIFVRFHGVDEWYSGTYSLSTLRTIAAKIKKIQPRDAYIYFNNDEAGYAVENVRMMEALLTK